MKKSILTTGLVALIAAACQNSNSSKITASMTTVADKQTTEESLHQFSFKTLSGEKFDFAQLKGKRVLIVNTASECGFTPQYEGLQELYESYGGEDFTIIGFPSNDFGNQEPGSNDEIKEFCRKNFGVSFPMMTKSSVTGKDKNTIYEWLTNKERNGRKEVEVQWNFNKFLIDENGHWLAYYPSGVKPMDGRIVSFAKGES